MTKLNPCLMAIAALCVLAATKANADTCNYLGTNYTCEVNCTTQCTAPFSFSSCDTPPIGNNDGKCAICGDGTSQTIYGSTGADIICGKGNNDTIRGDAGNDAIMGEGGNDSLYGEGGDDYLEGGSGSDPILSGGDGDDELNGGTGNEYLYGGTGNDALIGGDGSDYLQGDGAVLGDILCGGAGDDSLLDEGDGIHCFDGGKDQVNGGYGFGADCWYGGEFDCANSATYRNCATPIAYVEEDWDTSHRSCGCQ